MSAQQIMASTLLMGVLLLAVGLTGAIDTIGRYTPKSVIRGVQLSTGTLLMVQGFKMIMGQSKIQSLYQAAEPYLAIEVLGPFPIGLLIGIAGLLVTFALLDNKKLPAGLVVVLAGLALGLLLGKREILGQIRPEMGLPALLPFEWPKKIDFAFAAFALVMPQIPMTIGNAVFANADLSNTYFKEKSGKMTYTSLCISMAGGNLIAFLFGGMPMCHGAGGLSAHYRFGARTAGSNLMIGGILIALVLILGNGIVSFLNLIPMAVLGVLLIFAGSQLGMTMMEVSDRKDLFVIIMMLGITLAANLAVAFVAGMVLARLLAWNRINV